MAAKTQGVNIMKSLYIVVLLVAGFLSIKADTVYVSTNGTSVLPYSSWATAATNIQDAVDLSVDGDTVLVNDGVYRIISEISISLAITLESVNGSDFTTIDGQ